MLPLKLKIILGSTREGRFGDKPARWIFEEAKKKVGAEVELLDLRDYPMPFFNDPVSPSYRKGAHQNPVVAKWAAKIAEADAFIVVTPEYNHGYSGVLKNALDHVFPEWKNKPVSFVAYGGVGGARAVEQLRLVSVELQMAPMRSAVHIPAPWTLLDEKGNLKEGALDQFAQGADNLLTQLVWWADALRAARAKAA
ncbi:MAG: FMN reductase [Candidatus Lloydbacteria bacterium RIFCSPHIGHO2_02_FULL_50_13]|uniref:FMN reductase n=1 Tax=Candidatus Lloydbacteria bacterium RIFCSPHIGHO2_02_FULL_50_13 TaxID=1798661 RepID=A0A1G2D3J6_9BACT|nr:MAG: FMN reductase [Candidatus Lloydbacteria bacterium RIFCSPHIGHO2_02_FULL_50_13]